MSTLKSITHTTRQPTGRARRWYRTSEIEEIGGKVSGSQGTGNRELPLAVHIRELPLASCPNLTLA